MYLFLVCTPFNGNVIQFNCTYAQVRIHLKRIRNLSDNKFNPNSMFKNHWWEWFTEVSVCYKRKLLEKEGDIMRIRRIDSGSLSIWRA